VEPRQYEGRLLHQLPALCTRIGDVYAELYLGEPSDSNRVAPWRLFAFDLWCGEYAAAARISAGVAGAAEQH
jgi:hypothetical protein